MMIIKSASYRRMPWKNGGGLTAEIAIHPQGAVFSEGDFLWRLSAATIQAPGPFSRFVGCDRWLAVWKGVGINLNRDCLSQGETRKFAGEEEIFGAPVGGRIEDFGLIYRRDCVAAEMTWLPINGVASMAFGRGTHFFFCAEQEIVCAAGRLETGDCLRLENPAELEFRAEARARLIHVMVEVAS